MDEEEKGKLNELETRITSLEKQNILLWSSLAVSLAFLMYSRKRFIGEVVATERFLLVGKGPSFRQKKVLAELKNKDSNLLLEIRSGSLTIKTPIEETVAFDIQNQKKGIS